MKTFQAELWKAFESLPLWTLCLDASGPGFRAGVQHVWTSKLLLPAVGKPAYATCCDSGSG